MNFGSVILVSVPKIYSSGVRYKKFGIDTSTKLPFAQPTGDIDKGEEIFHTLKKRFIELFTQGSKEVNTHEML